MTGLYHSESGILQNPGWASPSPGDAARLPRIPLLLNSLHHPHLSPHYITTIARGPYKDPGVLSGPSLNLAFQIHSRGIDSVPHRFS